MFEKTDYGGCPVCDESWESRSWYVNCGRLVAHCTREHGFRRTLATVQRHGAR